MAVKINVVAGKVNVNGSEYVALKPLVRQRSITMTTDTERLDWIERKLFESHWNGVIDSGSRTYWQVRGDFRHTTASMEGKTLRDAIDAAMDKENHANI